jgi:hypothetical protein
MPSLVRSMQSAEPTLLVCKHMGIYRRAAFFKLIFEVLIKKTFSYLFTRVLGRG